MLLNEHFEMRQRKKIHHYYTAGIFVAVIISFLFFFPGFLDRRSNFSYFLSYFSIAAVYIFLIWLLCTWVHQTDNKWLSKYPFGKFSRSVFFILIAELVVAVLLSFILLFLNYSYGLFEKSASRTFYSKAALHSLVNINVFLLIVHGIVLSVYQSTSLADDKRKLSIEKEKLEKENIRSQFEALRQQVNPHFLFNSLNSLKVLAKEKSDHVEEYVAQLSNVYRYLLKHRQQDLVTLKNELEFIKSYLYLLSIRFEEGLNIEMDVADKYLESEIPPLTLQILIENAVKHNIISTTSPLHLKIYTNGADMLGVSNNKQLRQMVEGSSNFGLYNLNLQYKFLFGREIIIDKNEHRFSVYIPLAINQFK
jgi:sensor histidine kinase YesM